MVRFHPRPQGSGYSPHTTDKLKREKQSLEEEIETKNQEARDAVKIGREGLAERILEDKKKKMEELQVIEQQISELQDTQERLQQQKEELQTKVEEFGREKEQLKVKHEMAELTEQFASIESGTADVSPEQKISEIKDDIREKHARADAMKELSDDSETLEDEIQEMNTEQSVEEELSIIKEEVEKE